MSSCFRDTEYGQRLLDGTGAFSTRCIQCIRNGRSTGPMQLHPSTIGSLCLPSALSSCICEGLLASLTARPFFHCFLVHPLCLASDFIPHSILHVHESRTPQISTSRSLAICRVEAEGGSRCVVELSRRRKPRNTQSRFKNTIIADRG